MKIKVQFTFEGEIPEEYKYLAISDWGDRGVAVTLTEIRDRIQMVLSMQRSKDILLKTECVGYDVLEVI